MRKHLQAKRKHHWVWANYLTRWSKEPNKVHYTTKSGKIVHDSVRGIVVDDFFYKLSTLGPDHIEIINGYSRLSPPHLQSQHKAYLNTILQLQHLEEKHDKSNRPNKELELYLYALKCNLLENLHSAHETAAAPILFRLADRDASMLNNPDHMLTFMIFLGHQISRTKTFRDSCLMAITQNMPDQAKINNLTKEAWWFISYMLGMNIGWSFFAGRNSATHSLLINNSEVPFITSDQPLVNVHPCVSEDTLTPPQECDYFYPISPNVGYIIADSDRFCPRQTIIEKTLAEELNTKISAQAMTHIIGDSKEALIPFRIHLGRRYKKKLLPSTKI